MSKIDIKNEGDVLIISVTGDLTLDESIKVIREYYPRSTVKDVIWDCTDGSMQLLTPSDFRVLAGTVKEVIARGARSGGNTAFVAHATVEYGMIRMYTSIAESTGVSVKSNVFRTIAEARRWLDLVS